MKPFSVEPFGDSKIDRLEIKIEICKEEFGNSSRFEDR
jgi:hypothetical protein